MLDDAFDAVLLLESIEDADEVALLALVFDASEELEEETHSAQATLNQFKLIEPSVTFKPNERMPASSSTVWVTVVHSPSVDGILIVP